MFKLRIVVLALGIAVLAMGVPTQPASVAAGSLSEADSVVRWSKNQLRKPFKLGANGLRRYDCSGLVYRTFRETSLLKKIGGERTAAGYYRWFKSRGLVTRNPRKGDLVVWARRGQPVSHIGIYLGKNRWGKPMAISALHGGVAVHTVHGINKPLRAYLRVRIDR